ncbi:hypothetical protein PUNSTDRAFT_97516 [Punctularia strigosozonata HHB-11173 SS5]|uniref:uncharacterized protein n=1 Tax=Punctularia strigosozonata (strain HHB-11173) TaxID=741275 RepID=UPI0004417D36|nr:uncharacterized protein PUNSTDRAFT_97516 [Punctularia strigosozonata HHB-11173 SS5]EIN12698.1 hypothetical protein PUNSTDRAFT_97516 [Punctularia strigosozonata HHB-11173 SS5]
MSLPIAPKDISDHPTKGSVVDPINREKKEADVDRKLRLYGVIQAFRDGRLPSNAQIDETLRYVLDNSPVDLNSLSPEGRKLIEDTRDIVETAREMILEKNSDEVFQNFVWHTRDVDYDRLKKDPSALTTVDQQKAQQDSQQAVKHLRTLLSLVFTNSEARKLVSDFTVIGRDLLARGAAKAAEGIRPSEEQLRNVDQTAPSDQFVTEGGRTIGPNDGTPVPEVRVPGTGHRVAQHPHEPLGEGAAVKTEDGQVRRGGELRDQAYDTAQQAKDRATQEAQANANDIANTTNGIPENEEEKGAGKRTVMDRLRGVRDQVTNRVPDEHKERAREHRDRAKEFFSDEYFPPERRDQFIFRMKKVIVECQKHDDYQESIRWLLGYLEEYAGHAQNTAQNTKEHGQTSASQDSFTVASKEFRTLIERFANGRSTDEIWAAVDQLITDSRNDSGLRDWFKRVDAYVRKCLLEPGFVLEPACNNEAVEIRDTGRQFYDEKYKGHFDNLFSTIGGFFKAMGDDPLNQRFGQDWARLTKDLLFDSEGNLKYKPELWLDIRKVILPTLVDNVGYVPIPRIEYTDDNIDLVVENLTLSGRNLFPNIVSVEAHNFMKFSAYDAIKDEHHNEFTFTFAQMQCDMRDVAFWFRKKTGFPKLEDSGLADVLLGGEGLTVTVHLADAGKDQSSIFKVKNVHVKVDTLKFSIRDSKHDLLYKTLKPLATGLVKKQIQKAISDAITTGFEYIDGQLVGVRDRMAEAKAADDASRTQVLQQLFQSKKGEAKGKAQHVDQKTGKFQVVTDREHLLLPEHGHPSGYVNRANERVEAAKTGNDWHSDAFSIIPSTSTRPSKTTA